jgi:hypothetical protein
MKNRDTEPELPVTAEVGGEGGSFAEPTIQVPTKKGDVGRVDESLPEPPDTRDEQ